MLSGAFPGVFPAALNHLLAGEAWAHARLKPFAGQTVRLEAPPLPALDLTITAEGGFTAAERDASAAVTITLPADALLRLLGSRMDTAALMASAHIQGPADLADSLGFVLRNLRWDVESDLAACVGDIAAHRLTRFGRRFIDWQRKLARNLAENAVEYFTEERPAIAGRRDAERFSRDVGAAADRLAQLEKRIDALEAARHGR